MMFSQARQQQARAEKDAFTIAREAALAARTKPTGPRPTVLAGPTSGGLGTQSDAKRQKTAAAALPRCCLVAKSASTPSTAAPAASEESSLLGLGAYGSSDDGE